MGTLRSGIELYDGFTAPLMNIVNALNLTVSAFEDMQRASGNDIATGALDGAREAANQATAAIQAMSDTLANLGGGPVPPVPVPPTPVPPPVPPAPVPPPAPTPPPSPVPAALWRSDDLPVFTSRGLERYQQEIQSANGMLEQLGNTQASITQRAQGLDFLPPEAAADIQAIQARVQGLQNAITQVEQNPLDVDDGTASAQLERLRAQLSQALSAQEALNTAMNSADPVNVNDAYLRLSQTVGQAERSLWDNFSRPVEIPVQWRAPPVEVFTGTGLTRFQQEAQSAQRMVDTLVQSQRRISQQAANMNVFPPGAAADLTAMQGRIGAIQDRIQQLSQRPVDMGTDEANAELERLREQLAQALEAQQDLNRAVERMDVSAANAAYLRLSQTVGNTERYIRDNASAQHRFNQEIQQGTGGASQLMDTIKRTVAAYGGIQGLKKMVDLADQLTSTTARLNMMNDGLQTTDELQAMIFESAERSRGSYQETADAVAKLGLMAGDVFSSSAEIVAFMEQLNKQFTIAGTQADGVSAAMLQLTQAMGSGVLRGEEYNSILEQAPNVIQAIADYMEVPKGQLKDMAAEGKITADIVKSALFAAAEETNEKFESMPETFEQIGESIQNNLLMAAQPVLAHMNDAFMAFLQPLQEYISEFAASDTFQVMVDNIIGGLYAVGNAALWVLETAVNVGTAIADNWSWISPIIYGVAAALIFYNGYLLVNTALTALNNLQRGIAAVQAYRAAAANTALTAAEQSAAMATAAETAAQYGLNAAFLSCPITWIVVGILAVVAVFYAAVAAVNKFAGTTISATGIICGAISMAAAFVGNLFASLINFVLDAFALLWNFIASFANFLANVFVDPVGSIARLFFDLVDNILQLLQTLASAIDTLFGSSFAGAVQGWRNSLGGWVDKTFGRGEEIMAKVDAQSIHMERFVYRDARAAGYNFGKGIDEKIADFSLSDMFGVGDIPAADFPASAAGQDYGQYGASSGADPGDVSDIAGNTGKIADSMDVTEEELKWLRDIAEQETINRFTTADITIDMSGMQNSIGSDMDLDGIIDGMIDGVNEAVEIAAEGVHA